MSKVATKLGIVSAEQMYKMFIKELLAKNPTYKAKRLRSIADGQILDASGTVVFTYFEFKTILSACNKRVGLKLIKGYTYDFGYGLGDLFIARIDRNPNTTVFNRGASFTLRRKLKAENKLTETNWKVPYGDDDFISTVWHKSNGKMRNLIFYKFKTAGGQPGKGFRQALSGANKKNSTLKSLYPLLPTKKLEPKVK